jgi:Ran GTPase-activating protein (RanGAP) involved in mRNA processing and transport
LSDNKITSKGAALVARLIDKSDTLTELFLANNAIDGDGAKVLVASLKKRSGFKNIDLDNNLFSAEAISELFQMLPLSKLNLIKSILSDDQVESLSKQLKQNKSLMQIYMSHNKLSDQSLGLLADGLR